MCHAMPFAARALKKTFALLVDVVVKKQFYKNCLISRVLICSFLSSIKVQTDEVLIYESFQVQISAVKLSFFLTMRFYGLF